MNQLDLLKTANFKNPCEIKLTGARAFFNHTECGTERFSYDYPTPSALAGALGAVYGKTAEFYWLILSCKVCRDVKKSPVMQNEIKVTNTADGSPIYVNSPNVRSQRTSVILRDVCYVVRAVPIPRRGPHEIAKHRAMFRRRVDKGQCFYRPYLGIREFTAYFSKPDGTEQAIASGTKHLGSMLYGLRHQEGLESVGVFFDATIVDGVLHYPIEKFSETYGDKYVSE